MKRFLVPLAIFAIVVVFLAMGLTRNPREVPSPLIGKAVPAFRLPSLHQPDQQVSPADLRGQMWIFNVWASWCAACRDEHDVITELAKMKLIPVYGLNYKDKREDALAWLSRYGDPYAASLVDADGRVGIDFGVYGVPETYLIDQQGVIRYKKIGALTREDVTGKILPLVGRPGK